MPENNATLEPMGAFFDHRIVEYDAHQMTCIAGAPAFYPFTASCLPQAPHARVLEEKESTLIQYNRGCA